MRYHHDDGLDTDRTEKLATISESSVSLWHESHKECGVNFYSDHFSDSQRSSLSPTGGVKSTSPVTENHYQKWLRELYNIYTNFALFSLSRHNVLSFFPLLGVFLLIFGGFLMNVVFDGNGF